MDLVTANAMHDFTHAVVEPRDDPARADFLASVARRTARMTEVVDKMIETFAPKDGQSDETRAKHLKHVESAVEMMSDLITATADEIEVKDRDRVGPPPAEIVAMWDAHDAMVKDYYRLIFLRAEVDPTPRATGPVLETAEDIDAWMDSIRAS